MFLNRRRERGAVDAKRDLRVFALKFYTKEANWDMVGINPPVFFEVIVNQFDSTQSTTITRKPASYTASLMPTERLSCVEAGYLLNIFAC